MKVNTLLLVAVCSMLGMLVGCCHNRTISAVMPANNAVIYVGSGGIIEWDSWAGNEFTVQFQDGYNPCDPDPNKTNLTGTKDHPATCYVKPDGDGYYHYQILTPVPGGVAAGPVLAARVGPCNGCTQGGKTGGKSGKSQNSSPNTSTPAPSTKGTTAPVSQNLSSPETSTLARSSDYPPYIDLNCVGGTGTADPNNASAKIGDQIYWQKYGPAAAYTITFPADSCSNGVTTITSETPNSYCTVAKSFQYSFTVGACTTPITAYVTVQ